MSLVEDAKAAREAHMTYGQYMMSKPFKPFERPTGLKCINCGGPLYGDQRKYCSYECRKQMQTKNNRGDVFV